MMRYTISFAVATTAAAVAATTIAAHADVPQVVVDLPPVHGLVAQVMGDLGAPVLLLDQGANAHSFQLRPSQAGALSDAGLVVWIGPGMTPWLGRALEGTGATGRQLVLMQAEGTYLQGFQPHSAQAEAGHDHDHGEAEATAHDEDAHEADTHDAETHNAKAEAEDGHGHEGADPHVWLDPENGRVWLALIAAELSALDPENAATYAANAAAAQQELTALDAELTARLAPIKATPFVVGHDAYGYFVGHYGLNVAGAVALGDATAPGAASLSALRDDLIKGGVVCLFPEAAHDPKQAALLVEGTSVRLGGVLDPEGALVEPGPGAYAATLKGLADVLTDCLAQG